MIQNKEQIINYFKSGIKETDNLKIGIEHEKFLFDNKNNRRIDYNSILKMFDQLYEFGWKPIYEKTNIIGLTKDDKSITLEPGNQIELSGAKLNNIHEACAESHEYLFELKQVIEKLNFKIISAGFDPISKLSDIPNNPKQRYEVMTKDMPEGGSLSLDMMYRTCGTQLNVDYVSEQDFTKKFKLSNYLTPINIALFANSSVLEKKDSGYFSYRSHAWQQTSRGGLPEFFLEDFNFEKYADFAMNMSLLFLQRDGKYISSINNPEGLSLFEITRQAYREGYLEEQNVQELVQKLKQNEKGNYTFRQGEEAEANDWRALYKAKDDIEAEIAAREDIKIQVKDLTGADVTDREANLIYNRMQANKESVFDAAQAANINLRDAQLKAVAINAQDTSTRVGNDELFSREADEELKLAQDDFDLDGDLAEQEQVYLALKDQGELTTENLEIEAQFVEIDQVSNAAAEAADRAARCVAS